MNNKDLTVTQDISDGLDEYFSTVGENVVKDIIKHNPGKQQ